jgi:subtilisin family serine protease
MDSASCEHDGCYAKKVILWKDHFARCARGLKIGIIDTDVDLNHGTFAGSEIYKQAFMPAGRQVADAAHGTAVLALLAGRSDSATPGLVAQATFYVASIFFIGEDGEPQTDTVSLLRGLDWLNASEVQFVNMSFSGPADSLLEARLRKLRARGMVFAAAAGNEGLAADPSYPAAYSQVIAVTAVDKNLRVYPSASRGNYIDVAAPGVHVWTALPNAKQGYLSGTSFAVPFMTALLAIQRSDILQLPKNEILGNVKTIGLASESDSSTLGRGLIQAPGDCPNATQILTDRSHVSGLSLQ